MAGSAQCSKSKPSLPNVLGQACSRRTIIWSPASSPILRLWVVGRAAGQSISISAAGVQGAGASCLHRRPLQVPVGMSISC